MAITHKERIGRALDILREGLYPFVEREMRSVYQDNWLVAATPSVPQDPTLRRNAAQILQEDVYALLVLICDKWHSVFKKNLGHAERSLVGELRDTRNRWAHNGSFSLDDTYRALDSVYRLLSAISAPQAEIAEWQKKELLGIGFDKHQQFSEQKLDEEDKPTKNDTKKHFKSDTLDRNITPEPKLKPNSHNDLSPKDMLKVNLTPHREFLPADTPAQKLFLMLKLRPTKEVAKTRPSTTCAFLIDTSGSMYEIVAGDTQPTGHTYQQDGKTYNQVTGGITKLDIVMKSLRNLINSGHLDQNDRISLIQFDDQASTLIGLTPATQITQIEEAIAKLKDFSGGTCMGRGMNQALSLLANQSMTSRRALIFTDGETFDETECQQLAQEFANKGIPITALGIGEYNEDLLMNLGDNTGGRLHHVVAENAKGTQVAIADLPDKLFEEIGQAQKEVINNLALNVRTVEGVKLNRVTRVYPDQAEFVLTEQPHPIGVALGDDETVFILEFDVDSRISCRVRLAQLGLTYDVPGQKRRGELTPQNVVVQFIAGQGGVAQVDQEVMGYVQQRNISQLVGDATKVADSNPEQAEKLLETARRLTVKIGNKAMEESLNDAQDELRKTRKISAGTRKTVKMGSKGKTVKMNNDLDSELSDEQIRAISGT